MQGLCHKVIEDKTVLLEWKSLLDKLSSDYRKSRARLKPAIEAAKNSSRKHLDLLHIMEEGITTMLDGLDTISSFSPGGDPDLMNSGWVEMMEGYKEFRESGQKLARLSASVI